MRAAVVLLIVLNLALFAYARLDRAAQSEAGRLGEQVAPERIKIVTPREVAAMAPAKLVCIEWGPFADADRARAEGELQTLVSARQLSQRTLPSDALYWVNLGAMPNRAAADRRAADLRAQSIGDLSVVDYAHGQFTVSLGMFRSESAATARAETLAARGVLDTHVEPRPQGAPAQSMIVVRDAPEPLYARVKDLSTQYAGTDVRVAACPAS